jgi:hypothetical protein
MLSFILSQYDEDVDAALVTVLLSYLHGFIQFVRLNLLQRGGSGRKFLFQERKSGHRLLEKEETSTFAGIELVMKNESIIAKEEDT